jgi:GT2 family glycosyltransferase
MSHKASLIISIYNNVDFLRAVLDSLKNQTEQDFEIIISEDAQHEHVNEFIKSYPFQHKFQHISQPDLGWRKNKALNNAIRAAKSDWLIFIDGDCVLHPRFVEFHMKLSNPVHILGGKRVKLNAALSNSLLDNSPFLGKLQGIFVKMFFLGGKKGVGFLEEGIFINPLGMFGFIPRLRSMYQLKGCNMSFSKEAAVAINGFDEEYVLPAIGEDIDLTWRFKAAGYQLKSVRNLAVQYHLFHKESWIDQEENLIRMSKKQTKNEYACKAGLIQKS